MIRCACVTRLRSTRLQDTYGIQTYDVVNPLRSDKKTVSISALCSILVYYTIPVRPACDVCIFCIFHPVRCTAYGIHCAYPTALPSNAWRGYCDFEYRTGNSKHASSVACVSGVVCTSCVCVWLGWRTVTENFQLYRVGWFLVSSDCGDQLTFGRAQRLLGGSGPC